MISEQEMAVMNTAAPRIARGIVAFLKQRRWALLCLAILAASLVLNPVHPTGKFELCPMKRMTHLPCPGCGITHAIIYGSRGDFITAFRYHPLGPALWLLFMLFGSSVFWPQRMYLRARGWWRRHRERIEKWLVWGIPLLVLFGALRILFIYVKAPTWWMWY